MAFGSLYTPPAFANGEDVCSAGTLTANVVALDQPIMFNRLGAQNVNYMMYALERDVVKSNQSSPSSDDGKPITEILKDLTGDDRKAALADLVGKVALRPDKRPRPLVLRVAAGQCLQVTLTNLLDPMANPRNGAVNPNNCQGGDEAAQAACQDLMNINDQVEGRWVSFHPLGMQFVGAHVDTAGGSWVGENENSLVDHGLSGTYTYYAEEENAYMVYSRGQPLGGEASGGNVGVGLFAVVNVEPKGARFYRSQVTEEEMRLATKNSTYEDTDGYWGSQPIIDYEKLYPNEPPWSKEGKGGLPILNMVHNGEIVHSDINAIIAGPDDDGSWRSKCPGVNCPYPLERNGKRNPSLPNRLEAFREFTVVFHDDQAATQAFPMWFGHKVLGHTLHGVRDSFMINYGSGGIGSEIIANRLRVGPMWDCLNCAYEEFFLSSYTVGDPAMLVDVPANANLELCGPDELFAATGPNDGPCLGTVGVGGAVPTATHGIKASQAFFPDDPSNVHHSYKRDFVKFRNLHAGPKEQHIFHLHNHQWLFNPNDDNSNYIDAQGIGPGSGYTLEINFWGAGNRNISAGDAIFHCHFYPHFAQGMWEHWRINDVMQTGTVLAATPEDNGALGYHVNDSDADGKPDWALKNGLPATGARAYPDGEILAGTPIPAVVPLPGVALPPMPGAQVTVELKKTIIDGAEVATASVAKVHREHLDDGTPVHPGTEIPIGNPGYPFWIAGIEDAVGQRSTTPPLDMITREEAQTLQDSCPKIDGKPDPACLWSHPGLVAGAGGWDGGLPRHALEGYLQGGHSVNVQNRLDFTKVIEKAKPIYYAEEGTDLEQLVMAFNAQPPAASWALNITGEPSSATFVVNGQKPVPSAPFYEPCRDDNAELFLTGQSGDFWNADLEGGYFSSPVPVFGADAPRVYMGANIQIDAVLNKVGYHYPQQRIIALWDDVDRVIKKQQAPEPLVMRANSFDCVKYLHANLVPEYFELDDYQVRTPTDIIGQHIHLPKWDLVANDGSGNGWNYEDGTLSPGMVRERIHAINKYLTGDKDCDSMHENADQCLEAVEHPFFGAGLNSGAQNWIGARTTIQRWFTDPVVNTELEDRGLGLVFTHDHYGPSTHQQVGLYATILAQPYGSTWKHNETGDELYDGRPVAYSAGCETGQPCSDGGPTSWQAIIDPTVAGIPGTPAEAEPFREFYFEFGDFQHAYEAGTYVGIGNVNHGDLTAPKNDFTHSPVTSDTGTIIEKAGMEIVLTPPVAPDGAETFLTAINPSFRQEPRDKAEQFPDIVRFPPYCAADENGDPIMDPDNPGNFLAPRPCAEAISADDVGLIGLNYRVEPVGLRVYDPTRPGPDGHDGIQAEGIPGDLAFALQSRTDRAIAEMNVQPAGGSALNGTVFPPPINHGGVGPGDPFTPMLRAYPDDLVKIKIQAGSTEHEHNATIHGVKWLQSGSAFGQAPNSGWRNAQNDGISEQFTFHAPMSADVGFDGQTHDYAYSLDASQDGWWTGMWGILRTYENPQPDLEMLSNNQDVNPSRVANADDFDGVCPITADVKEYQVVAVLANDVLPNVSGLTLDDPNDDTGANDFPSNRHVGALVDPYGGTLVYNDQPGGKTASGARSDALHDPTAMLYVLASDLEPVDATARECRDNRRRPGVANPQCDVELVGEVEPLALRAEAGDCIKVTLFNRIPEDAPDLAGYNTLLQMVNRRVDVHNGNKSLHTFNNNLIRPSSYVGLHPQMVAFDVTKHDGVSVGLNGMDWRDENDSQCDPDTDTSGTCELVLVEPTMVAPVGADGDTPESVTYTWYAGHLSTEPVPPNPSGKGKPKEPGQVTLVATPVEFGGFNLNPADKVKQGQKALVGAGVILPEGSTWTNEDGTSNENGSTTVATVTAGTNSFRDAALVFQKGLNMRFSDGTAIPNIAAEGLGVPEDSHDAGQMAINYGSEPLWYRFGYAADAPLGNGGPGTFGGEPNPELAYSNTLPIPGGGGGTYGDPATPVITATPGEDVRMRVLMPTGSGRGTTFVLDGHAWQRDPYLCPEGEGEAPKDGLAGRCDPFDEVGSRVIADGKANRNPIGFVIGHQESVTPGAHFDIVPLNGAGGKDAVPGDYLFSDQGSFGPTSGLWGILRVAPAAP